MLLYILLYYGKTLHCLINNVNQNHVLTKLTRYYIIMVARHELPSQMFEHS